MNMYILVEGRVTEMMIYSKWISYLIPKMSVVQKVSDIEEDNFYMFSGYGYPNILGRLAGCINDINRHGNIDYLVICLDSEDESIKQRKNIINKRIASLKIKLNPKTRLQIIVHNRCIETWFLGNRDLWKGDVKNELLRDMIEDYNIFKQDPERLNGNRSLVEHRTRAQYHYCYLKHLFNENKIAYTKKNPGRTTTQKYLRSLIERNGDTGHIPSFGYFVEFCRRRAEEI